MAAYFSPIGNGQIIDVNGTPVSGGTITTYAAGSSTPITAYTSSAGDVAQANPATLNSVGALDNPLWLAINTAYKIVVKDENESTLFVFDNITGIGSSVSSSAADEWVLFAGTATYISATSFSVVGNQTDTFQVGRKTKSQNSGGISYGTITDSVFSAGNTTVTLSNSVLALDVGLSAMYYGFLSAINSSVPLPEPDAPTPAPTRSMVDISSASSTITWDVNAAPDAKITLDGNKTFANPIGLTSVGDKYLQIVNPASYTVTFASGYNFVGRPAYPPDLGTGGNVTILTAFCDGEDIRTSYAPFVS